MPSYAPHRQRLPLIAVTISSPLGCGVRSSNASADISCPGVQNPHWKPSSSVKARRSRSSRSPSASTVRTDAPSQAAASVRQDNTGRSSTSTVQLPHVPSPHATLVPVSSNRSRSTADSGSAAGTSTR